MNIMLLFSGLVLANKEPNKVALESITGVNVVEQYKIIPKEIVQQAVAKKATTSCRKKATPTKKKTTKKKVVKKKTTKKKAKKKVVKKKKTVKKTYVSYNKSEIQSYVYNLMLQKGWSESEWYALNQIVIHESSWNPYSVNKKSGACGLFQAYKCSKMKSYGSDYKTNYKVQANWGLDYIKARYGSPTSAWAFWQKHHWY